LHKYPSPTLTCGSIEPPSPTRGEGTITATALALLLTMSNSPSRSRGAFLRPGFASLLHSPRIEGWAERRETFGCSAEHPWGLHVTRQARRLRGALRPIARQDARERAYDAGRSPLGAPPWRFWALGPRFRLPHYTGAAQRAPRSQVVVPGGRGPAPPEASGYEPPPQDATPRSAFRIVSRTRPQ
jgi:hypothetical protein